MRDFSDHHHAVGDNLKFLFENLGLKEVFDRLDALDGQGTGPEDPEFNPTNDRMVQPNLEGVGSLSGGPNSENQGTLDILESERMAQIQEAADDNKTADSKKTTTSSRTSSSTAKK